MGYLAEGEKCTVLLVDDHEGLRQELRDLLTKQEDIEVIGAVGDGDEALHFLKSCEPHVIILDLTMPKMDGIEAAGLIKRSCPSVVIIGLCFTHDPMTVDAFLRAGATAVLSKADQLKEVTSIIRRACPRRASASQVKADT